MSFGDLSPTNIASIFAFLPSRKVVLLSTCNRKFGDGRKQYVSRLTLLLKRTEDTIKSFEESEFAQNREADLKPAKDEMRVLAGKLSGVQITKADITELTRLSSPPAAVILVVSACCVAMGMPPQDWPEGRKAIKKMAFVRQLVDKDHQPKLTRAQEKYLNRYARLRESNPDFVRRMSCAAGELAKAVLVRHQMILLRAKYELEADYKSPEWERAEVFRKKCTLRIRSLTRISKKKKSFTRTSKKKDYRGRIVKVLKAHAPDKVKNVDKLLERFAGQEEVLLGKIMTKYNVKN